MEPTLKQTLFFLAPSQMDVLAMMIQNSCSDLPDEEEAVLIKSILDTIEAERMANTGEGLRYVPPGEVEASCLL